ncbi:DinB family protein [Ulvibacterium sp.]|uniref:DinB family protein n=1 Tax=Ulvibacterium sp. TaxID=2665914 RepID=UPI003BA96E8B
MEKLFNITLQNRKTLLNILENTPKETLVKIPKGYRNNIWWNIAHVTVTQQLLVYNRSNVPMLVPQELVDKFKKGTLPDGTMADGEKERIASLLISAIERTEEDFKKGVFTEFNEYTTSAKVTLNEVGDAIAFNVFHEGLHLGAIRSLQKALAS